MAVYKVIQDIEAEDKLLGWMSLKEFIFFCIAALNLYLCFISIVKGFPYMLIFFVPVAIGCGLMAAPLSKVQPTEVLLAARIQFFLKPRKRIWDQTGVQDLVTITVPKTEHHDLTKGFDQTEVESRLKALASTLDSRGWAVRNVGTDRYTQPRRGGSRQENSDRLLNEAAFLPAPQRAATTPKDILDPASSAVAKRFDSQIQAASERAHATAVARMNASANLGQQSINPFPAQTIVKQAEGPAAPRASRAAADSKEDRALLAYTGGRASAQSQTSRLRTLSPQAAPQATPAPAVTGAQSPAILELAQNNSFSVATLSAQAKRSVDDKEVTIKLR